MNWNQWLCWASLKLKKSNNSRREAEIILEKVINKSRVQLLTLGNTLLHANEIKILESLIIRRIKGEPIAYLIGEKEFWSLNFKVTPGVFIPRPDTECLIEQALCLASTTFYLNALDLGTGVGTIAIALASERPYWNITGIDLQKKALILAKKNQQSFNLKNIHFKYGNWFKYLKKEKYNLIVSNPPYINTYDSSLTMKDMHFEPKQALVSSNTGLTDLTIICHHSVAYLYPKGWLILEHGWNQGKYIRKLFNQLGFTNVCTVHDYHGHERVTYGQKNFFY